MICTADRLFEFSYYINEEVIEIISDFWFDIFLVLPFLLNLLLCFSST